MYDVEPPPERVADSVQFRIAFSTDRGNVTLFLVQLEYWYRGDWRPVVRDDHDRDSVAGHDVSVEGLHRDIYRDGAKYRTASVTPPIPANEAFEYAEDDFRDNAQRYVRRFESWRDVIDSSDL